MSSHVCSESHKTSFLPAPLACLCATLSFVYLFPLTPFWIIPFISSTCSHHWWQITSWSFLETKWVPGNITITLNDRNGAGHQKLHLHHLVLSFILLSQCQMICSSSADKRIPSFYILVSLGGKKDVKLSCTDYIYIYFLKQWMSHWVREMSKNNLHGNLKELKAVSSKLLVLINQQSKT